MRPSAKPTTTIGAGRRIASLGIQAGARNSPTLVALDWYNEAEDLFSTSYEYVCHGYRALQDFGGSFNLDNLGSYMGTLYVTPAGNHAVIGQIKELEPNRESLRQMSGELPLRATEFRRR